MLCLAKYENKFLTSGPGCLREKKSVLLDLVRLRCEFYINTLPLGHDMVEFLCFTSNIVNSTLYIHIFFTFIFPKYFLYIIKEISRTPE